MDGSRRVKLIRITGALVLVLLRAIDTSTGCFQIPLFQGVPEDAKLVASFGDIDGVFNLVIESESFDFVPDDVTPPELVVEGSTSFVCLQSGGG